MVIFYYITIGRELALEDDVNEDYTMEKTSNSPPVKENMTITPVALRTEVTKALVAGSGAVGKTTLVRVLKDCKSLNQSNHIQEYHRTPFIELETVKVERVGEPDLVASFYWLMLRDN